MTWRTCFALLVATTLLFSGSAHTSAERGNTAKASRAAVERARKTVRMLDDIYKQTIVLITSKYVKTKNDYPAGRAAVRLFNSISKGGSHTVRLIDVSGEPYNPDNVAKDAFEKEAVKHLKNGKVYVDRVEKKDGKKYLRAMTFVPVVMTKCILCHEHYAKAKKNEAVGAISYSVPIE